MTETAIQDTLDIATIISLILFLNFAASLLIFAQFGMRALEKKLPPRQRKDAGRWDYQGGRITIYAIQLSLPTSLQGKDAVYSIWFDPVLHQMATLRHRLLAMWFLTSFLLFMLYGIYYVRES